MITPGPIYRMISDLQDDNRIKHNEIILLTVMISGAIPQDRHDNLRRSSRGRHPPHNSPHIQVSQRRRPVGQMMVQSQRMPALQEPDTFFHQSAPMRCANEMRQCRCQCALPPVQCLRLDPQFPRTSKKPASRSARTRQNTPRTSTCQHLQNSNWGSSATLFDQKPTEKKPERKRATSKIYKLFQFSPHSLTLPPKFLPDPTQIPPDSPPDTTLMPPQIHPDRYKYLSF